MGSSDPQADTPSRRQLLFLDRDGTVIVEKGYLTSPEGVELLPGVASGLARFRTAGYRIVIVSNQSVIGRGLCSRADVDQVNSVMLSLLSTEGVQVDGVFICPHGPEDGCDCRKPGTALLEMASNTFAVPLQGSIMIGDKPSDIEAGRRVGAFTVLVRTGYGNCYPAEATKADLVADSLLHAAQIILGLSE